MTKPLKVGTLVTDKSASGRYDLAVYRITGHSFDRSIVEFVGTVRNGRITYDHSGSRSVTHRTTANLAEWR